MWIPAISVGLIVVLIVAQRRRPDLTGAVLSPLVGAFLGGSLIALVVINLTFIRWDSPILIGVVFGLVFSLLTLTALPLWLVFYLPLRWFDPVEAGSEVDAQVVDPWLAAGCTDVQVMRWRPKGKRTFTALTGPNGGGYVFLINAQGRLVPLVLSSVGSGSLMTTDEVNDFFDRREVRQIINAKDPTEFLARHRDALIYLQELGAYATNEVSAEVAIRNLAERYIAVVKRRPWRIVTSMFRPPFHLGPLRSRLGRRWQVRTLGNAT